MIPLHALGLLESQQLLSRVLPGSVRAAVASLQAGRSSAAACGAGPSAAVGAAASSDAHRRSIGTSSSTSGSSRGAGRAAARQQQQQPQQQRPHGEELPWGRVPDDQLPLQFSLRPSVLSPLHAIYKEYLELQRRANFAAVNVAAQLKLAEEVDATRDDEVEAELAARREKLSALVNDYASSARAGTLPPPSEPGEAQGYMWVLEQQLASKHPEFVEWARVEKGERDVWDYWFNDFFPKYDGLPGLAPLEKAINRPSSLEEAQRLRRRALRQLMPQEGSERRQPKIDALGRARATGRRKTATAQVVIWEGAGRVLVNRAPLDRYFSDVTQRAALLKPLMAVGALGRFDVAVQVSGSGRSGQAQAAAHGIARALQDYDPAAYRSPLKRGGLLRRDPRMVERKKPGRKKARKSFTWVKR